MEEVENHLKGVYSEGEKVFRLVTYKTPFFLLCVCFLYILTVLEKLEYFRMFVMSLRLHNWRSNVDGNCSCC